MIDGILSFAIHQRWLVMIGVFAMAGLGAWNFTRLQIDAVPDITNVQVQINSRASGYSPLEVEQRITFPIETAMGGLPRLENTRSQSRYGLSQVTVIFKDGTDVYFARQLVNERIQQAKDQSAMSGSGSRPPACAVQHPSRPLLVRSIGSQRFPESRRNGKSRCAPCAGARARSPKAASAECTK
jgi:multidrug efflux pump subunit AcrB